MSAFQLSIGVGLGICGASIGSLGVVFQKKSASVYRCRNVSLIKQPWWLWGVMLVICGGFIEFAALFFAPLVVVGTLVVTRLVWITIFAHIILHENVNRIHVLAIILLLVGCNLIILSYYVASGASSVSIDIFEHTIHWIYLGAFVTVAIGITYITYINHHVKYALGAGLLAGVCQFERKILSSQFENPVISDTEWWIKAVLTCVIISLSAVCMLWFHAQALKNTSTIFTSSIMDAIVVLMNIVTAGILFEELASYDVINWVITVSGVAIIISGIRVMLTQENDPPPCEPYNDNESITL